MSLDVETIGPAPLDPGAEQVHVRTRDGIQLATDVYLGDDTTPRPAVLVRLPYDKSGRYTFMPQLAPTSPAAATCSSSRTSAASSGPAVTPCPTPTR